MINLYTRHAYKTYKYNTLTSYENIYKEYAYKDDQTKCWNITQLWLK